MRIKLSQKFFGLGFIPFFAFLVMVGMFIKTRVHDTNVYDDSQKMTELMLTTNHLVTDLQIERSLSHQYTKGFKVKEQMLKQRLVVDKYKGEFIEKINKTSIQAEDAVPFFESMDKIKEFRKHIDNLNAEFDVEKKYSEVIFTYFNLYQIIPQHSHVPVVSENFAVVYLLEQAKENTGILRTILVEHIENNNPMNLTEKEHVVFLKNSLNTFLFSPSIKVAEHLEEDFYKIAKKDEWIEFEETYNFMMSNSSRGKYGLSSKEYYDVATTIYDDIEKVIEGQLNYINENLMKEVSKLKTEMYTALIASILFAIFIFGGILWFSKMLLKPINDANMVVKSISDGDLTKTVEATFDDEIGDMAKMLNQTVGHIKNAFGTDKIEWLDLQELKRREREAMDDAKKEKQLAEMAKDEALESSKLADEAAAKAKDEADKATEAMKLADEEKEKAQKALENAEVERKKAAAASEEANKSKEEAERSSVQIKKILEEQQEEANHLRKSVESILEVVNAAANGDLTKVITVSGEDPIGQVGQGLKKFFDNLKSSLISIGGSAAELNVSASDLSKNSGLLKDNASMTNHIAEKASAGCNKANINIQAVTSSMNEMTQSIEEISQSTLKASELSISTSRDVKNANALVEGLAKSSDDIGNIVNMISSIAKQTNLLALNATIESARAGEAGKGFAVVAGEVKELARQTAKATDEISGQIQLLQQDASKVTQAIGTINTSVEQLNQFSINVSAAVEEQVSASKEVASSAGMAANEMKHINENMVEVTGAGESTGRASDQVGSSAENLVNISNNLNMLVGKFRLTNKVDKKAA